MPIESSRNKSPIADANSVSRRQFFSQSAIYGGTFLAMLNMPRPLAFAAAEASTGPVVFSENQWKLVEAITGRIIPTDHEPGAIEANCVNFIDKALANEDETQKPLYEKGLKGLAAFTKKRFGKNFPALEEAEQDEALIAIESGETMDWPEESGSSSDFFAAVRGHTIIGFLADPKYGGNKDYSGWKVIGYPGPSHHTGGYSPDQLVGKEPVKPIWDQPHH